MLKTFRIGGIHPPENKLSAGKKITALAAPKQVTSCGEKRRLGKGRYVAG